jgi:two-component sensor histidine kinase
MHQVNQEHLGSRVDAALSYLRRLISPGSVQAYALAFTCFSAATLLEFGLLWIDKGAAKLIAFFPAIAFAALLGGIGPGVLVALLGGLTAWLVFMPPSYSFALESYGDKISLVTYGVISIFVAWVGNYFGRLSERLEDEEQLRELAVQELAHRLKNKIATIQAIISVQLRDSPQVRDGILARLTALTVTDHLIEKANGQGAYIRDIAATELAPYIGSQATIQGSDVLLPPKYALTVALIIHELATNAAKYGSLSVPEGRVSLRSSISNTSLSLEWNENNGPPVSAPTRRGFGLKLLSRALTQFGGTVETFFEPTGLTCKMNLTLPAATLNSIGNNVSGPRSVSAIPSVSRPNA